jgi:Spy/CpxP family protein refolding chaperone
MAPKKMFGLVLVFLVTLSLSSFVFAGGHEKEGYKKKCPVLSKIYKVLKHSDQIGLTEEQTEKGYDLLVETKKKQIKLKSEIELVKLDLKVLFYKEKFDINKANKLIDQKYELKKKKAKNSTYAFAKFKNMLSEEQNDELKKFFLGKNKSKCKKANK